MRPRKKAARLRHHGIAEQKGFVRRQPAAKRQRIEDHVGRGQQAMKVSGPQPGQDEDAVGRRAETAAETVAQQRLPVIVMPGDEHQTSARIAAENSPRYESNSGWNLNKLCGHAYR